METLYQLWQDHLASPFPEELYEKPGGVDMMQVDAFVAGCASSVVETGHYVEAAHGDHLQRWLREIESFVLPELKRHESMRYCGRLLALGRTTQNVVNEENGSAG